MTAFVPVVMLLFVQLNPAPVAPQLASMSIEGIVLRAGTGEPIPGTRVVVQSVRAPLTIVDEEPRYIGGPRIPPVTTGRDGKFVINDLAPGTYRLNFASDGYVTQEYGQRTSPGSGLPVTLATGERLSLSAVALTPTGTVTGRILDPNGRPLAKVPVSLMRYVDRNPDLGMVERTLERIQRVLTDDRGEYRLFFVTPGRYYVSAGTATLREVDLDVNGTGTLHPRAHTFYPGVSDVALARPIDVPPGEEIGRIDMIVERIALHTVKGRVVDSRTGSHPPSAEVTFIAENGESVGSTAAYRPATGEFEVRFVPRGSYIVVVRLPADGGDTRAGTEGGAPSRSRAGVVRVHVEDAGIDGVLVTVF